MRTAAIRHSAIFSDLLRSERGTRALCDATFSGEFIAVYNGKYANFTKGCAFKTKKVCIPKLKNAIQVKA